MKLEIFHPETAAEVFLPGEPASRSDSAGHDWLRAAPRRSTDLQRDRNVKCSGTGVEKAISLIRNEYSRPLTVSFLARECGMSVRTLHRSYRSLTGNTIVKDLTARRIKAVKEMLKIDGLKLEPIAMETGLGSAKNLCRLFKEHLGVTPRQWKESHRGQMAEIP